MIALDWDAAGPIAAAHEAVAVAIDWAGGDRKRFAEAIAVYQQGSGLVVAREPWVFGGWVAALGGWLDYNADHRAGEKLGRAEITISRRRLHALAVDLDFWVRALDV